MNQPVCHDLSSQISVNQHGPGRSAAQLAANRMLSPLTAEARSSNRLGGSQNSFFSSVEAIAGDRSDRGDGRGRLEEGGL